MQFNYHGEVQRSRGGMQCNARRGDWVTQPMKHRRASFLFPSSPVGREERKKKRKKKKKAGGAAKRVSQIANSPGTIHLRTHL